MTLFKISDLKMWQLIIISLVLFIALPITALSVYYTISTKIYSKSMEMLEFTQCFQPIGKPNWLIVGDFYEDKARNCYGQKWAIPRAYLKYGDYTDRNTIFKTDSSTKSTDIKLIVDFKSLAPASLINKEYHNQRLEINIKSMANYFRSFEARLAHEVDVASALRIQKSSVIKFGMQMYVEPNPEPIWH